MWYIPLVWKPYPFIYLRCENHIHSYIKQFYYIMILFKQLYRLSCCHLTFRKIWYCLIKTRIDLVSLSFSNEIYKKNHVNSISIRPMDIKAIEISSNQNRRISVTLEWTSNHHVRRRRWACRSQTEICRNLGDLVSLSLFILSVCLTENPAKSKKM